MYTVVEFIKTRPDAILPQPETLGAAGSDLTYVGPTVVLNPMSRCVAACGMKIALEPGYEAQIRPRSGLAAKHGITVLNAPGTIDSDYRGEVKVILINLGDTCYLLESGTRIAQMVIKPVCKHVVHKFVTEFSVPTTDRGENGLGSTGFRSA